jgi:hypothetical protein
LVLGVVVLSFIPAIQAFRRRERSTATQAPMAAEKANT